jgi:hypothetical protein
VRIAPVPSQHRQQQRAQQVAFARRVRAGEGQRAIRHPAVKQTALLEILNEKRQLSQWRDRCRGVPLDMNTAGKSLSNRRPLLYLRLLTHRVSGPFVQICSHGSLIRRFGRSAQPATAGFRLIRLQSQRGVQLVCRHALSLASSTARLNRVRPCQPRAGGCGIALGQVVAGQNEI